jgi:hypothetical protein
MLFFPSPQEILAINSCTQYIHGISRYEHISNYTNRILGIPLDVHYSMSICCMINKIIKSGGPRYLCNELRFGLYRRLFNLLVPAHSLNARGCSFFVQGTILWNDLPPAVKREGSMGKFKAKCLSHLGRSASPEASKVSVIKNEIKMKIKWKKNKYYSKLCRYTVILFQLFPRFNRVELHSRHNGVRKIWNKSFATKTERTISLRLEFK